MILKDHKKIEFGSDRSDDDNDEVPPLEDCSDVEIAYSVERETLIIRCVLTVQVKEDVDKQRENIFHTRCHIQNKVCSMIIDGGSCANITSTTLVRMLNLSTIKHYKPYKIR
jgi:hypothetical protein